MIETSVGLSSCRYVACARSTALRDRCDPVALMSKSLGGDDKLRSHSSDKASRYDDIENHLGVIPVAARTHSIVIRDRASGTGINGFLCAGGLKCCRNLWWSG